MLAASTLPAKPGFFASVHSALQSRTCQRLEPTGRVKEHNQSPMGTEYPAIPEYYLLDS